MAQRFADIHCHPTLHPFAFFNVGKQHKNSLWSDNPPKARQRRKTYPEYFQTSMPALARGNVRLVVAALYPLEQPWFKPRLLGERELGDFIASRFMVHIPDAYIDKVQSASYNYFEYLKKEYQFLTHENGKVHSENRKEWKYKLARDQNEIQAFLDEPNTIVVLPSVEGAHSLISGNADDLFNNTDKASTHIKNIEYIKREWDYVPLYLTLGHHFYNGICGHARSIPDGAGSFFLDQNIGLGEPINSRGLDVIDCLLGINAYQGNGKRILVDTKHMSVAARVQYHEKIARYNKDKAKVNRIPIIASHSAFGDSDKLLGSIIQPDTDPEKYKTSKTFNNWSINLSKDEIVDIFLSGGIIGLNLDQRVLSGHATIEIIDQEITRHEIKTKSPEMVKLWSRQVAKNIMAMVKAVTGSSNISEQEKQQVWDLLSLGTDFDGMINPIDSCIVADEYDELRQSLSELLPLEPDFSSLSYGLSTGQILDKIMYQNAVDFALRNYAKMS